MILIGQYDSPFVRRVAVALTTYGRDFDHWPWSSFQDAERLAAYNPLRRVPTLVLEDGEVLIESGAILDHLDESADSRVLMMARTGPERRAALGICALATGLCDKMVSLVYERVLHEATSEEWVSRCESQMSSVLSELERRRGKAASTYWFGERLGHADVAVACAMRFLREAYPGIRAAGGWPALDALAERCEDLPAFRAATQTFLPPPSRAG